MNQSDYYAIYLRKSRMDMDAEAAGAGETLERHRTALTALAHQRRYPVGQIYQEVVSGETISGRPQMQQLLADVEAGKWRGVLVMEESRLARGDTMDQGRVQQAFYYSHTLIITPSRIFDPDSEADQEYFEFGLFMSRREYKMINRRLQRGKDASAREGKWGAGNVPLGYKKVDIPRGKGKTLEIVPEQAEIVRTIFKWYVEDNVPIFQIAVRLDEAGVKGTRGGTMNPTTVATILNNPTYCGYIRHGVFKRDKKPTQAGMNMSYYRNEDVEGETLFRGLHPPIISEELFLAAKAKRTTKVAKGAPGPKSPLVNQFAGLAYCPHCGKALSRSEGYQKQNRLWCMTRSCPSGTTNFRYVDQMVMDSLRNRLAELEVEGADQDTPTGEQVLIRDSMATLEKELQVLEQQKNKAYTLVEQGIYSAEVFVQRMRTLEGQERALRDEIGAAGAKLAQMERLRQARQELAPKIRHVVEVYPTLEVPEAKNRLLKTIISEILVYHDARCSDMAVKITYIL